MDFKKIFKEEKRIDLEDTEYVGVFPYFSEKKNRWVHISRGEGWKRYSEWLEEKLKHQKGGDDEA